MLPKIVNKKAQDQQFPCLWQAVVFRNYGFVSTDKIAKTLGCDEKNR